jgi:type II secretory pathway component PulF
MKKFLSVLLVLLGLGAVAFLVTQKQSEARRLWDEALAKIPTPGCDCCVDA